MSAIILRLRDTLEEVAREWDWTFSSASRKNDSQIKFSARNKETGVETIIYIQENLLHQLPLKTMVHDMIRLLPSKVRTMTADADNSINVQQHYNALRGDYRDRLERMRRQASRLGNAAVAPQ